MEKFDKIVSSYPEMNFEPSGFLRTEGSSGIRNLGRICRLLGYKDFQNFGYFDGASYGDLINFLEDNPGAVEAIYEWMLENYTEELDELVKSDENEESE